jgi:hypothetical protein
MSHPSAYSRRCSELSLSDKTYVDESVASDSTGCVKITRYVCFRKMLNHGSCPRSRRARELAPDLIYERVLLELPDGVGCLYGGERRSSVKLQRPDVEVDAVKLSLDFPSKATKDLSVPSLDLQPHYLRYAR